MGRVLAPDVAPPVEMATDVGQPVEQGLEMCFAFVLVKSLFPGTPHHQRPVLVGFTLVADRERPPHTAIRHKGPVSGRPPFWPVAQFVAGQLSLAYTAQHGLHGRVGFPGTEVVQMVQMGSRYGRRRDHLAVAHHQTGERPGSHIPAGAGKRR